MSKTICVFCGSRNGTNPHWIEQASALGSGIAKRGWHLVFGGGSFGLMGAVSDAAIKNNGIVTGIIPERLTGKEGISPNLSKLHIVKNMRERKEMMEELSDAFVIIPGGIGTLEEFFEIWSARHVGSHNKPIILANWNNFYDGLLQFIRQSQVDGFVTDFHLDKMQVVHSLDELFNLLESY